MSYHRSRENRLSKLNKYSPVASNLIQILKTLKILSTEVKRLSCNNALFLYHLKCFFLNKKLQSIRVIKIGQRTKLQPDSSKNLSLFIFLYISVSMEQAEREGYRFHQNYQ